MGRKPIVTEFYAINGGDMSSNITSPATDCQFQDHVQYLVEWNGTAPVGQFLVQQSTDNKLWTSLDFGVPIAPVGNIGSHTILVEKITFKWIRIIYNATSGVGLLTVKYSASTVGA